jgi:hypothetical protein
MAERGRGISALGQAFLGLSDGHSPPIQVAGTRGRGLESYGQAFPGAGGGEWVPPAGEEAHYWRKWWYEDQLNDVPIGVQVMRDIGQYMQSEHAVEGSVPQAVLYS